MCRRCANAFAKSSRHRLRKRRERKWRGRQSTVESRMRREESISARGCAPDAENQGSLARDGRSGSLPTRPESGDRLRTREDAATVVPKWEESPHTPAVFVKSGRQRTWGIRNSEVCTENGSLGFQWTFPTDTFLENLHHHDRQPSPLFFVSVI